MKIVEKQNAKCEIDSQYNVFCENRTARISQCVWDSFDQKNVSSDSVLNTQKTNSILVDDGKFIDHLLTPGFSKEKVRLRKNHNETTVVMKDYKKWQQKLQNPFILIN